MASAWKQNGREGLGLVPYDFFRDPVFRHPCSSTATFWQLFLQRHHTCLKERITHINLMVWCDSWLHSIVLVKGRARRGRGEECV